MPGFLFERTHVCRVVSCRVGGFVFMHTHTQLAVCRVQFWWCMFHVCTHQCRQEQNILFAAFLSEVNNKHTCGAHILSERPQAEVASLFAGNMSMSVATELRWRSFVSNLI